MSTLSIPEYVPSPLEDAKEIHNACGSDEWTEDAKKITSILAHRSVDHRSEIRKAYAKFFKNDIVELFGYYLNYDINNALELWVLDPAKRDAKLANGYLFREGALIEIACARSSEEILGVRYAYHALYQRLLEEDITAITVHGNIDSMRLLVSLLTACRYDPTNPDGYSYIWVDSEARLLHERITSRLYTDDDIIRILATRSIAQLQATFKLYHEQFGHSITKDLKSNPNDRFLSLLRNVIKCIACPVKYFEKTIRLAMKMEGSFRENILTRVIVTRAEVDLKLIKDLYFKKNGVPLVHDIKKIIWKEYADFLITIIGED